MEFIEAAMNGRLEIVQELLVYGADPDQALDNNCAKEVLAPLLIAKVTKDRNIDGVRKLFEGDKGLPGVEKSEIQDELHKQSTFMARLITQATNKKQGVGSLGNISLHSVVQSHDKKDINDYFADIDIDVGIKANLVTYLHLMNFLSSEQELDPQNNLENANMSSLNPRIPGNGHAIS